MRVLQQEGTVEIRPSAGRTRPGFALAEITVAVTVFALMAGGVTYSLLQARNLSWANRERTLALDAAQSVIEQVRGETFSEAFVRFNATTADDPPGPPFGLPSPGNTFAVPGLTPQAGDPDGMVGEVFFPGDGTSLREDVQDREWGLPRDLNLDGNVDALDHAPDDYRILPVRVRVAWRSPVGNRQVELVSFLVEG